MAFRTSNPALTTSAFAGLDATGSRTMTVAGTVNRTGVLLLLLIVSAACTWNRMGAGGEAAAVVPALMLVGALGGFGVAILTIFVRRWSPVTAPIYAILEGLFLGGISAFFEAQYKGIVMQATILTFGTMGALLFAYRAGFIRVTEKFRLGIFAATGGICLFYLIAMVLNLFGIAVPLIHSSGPFGIAFSAVVVIIAALNLVLDFDFIERAAAARAPQYMEWYGAFGLIVTLVWLYIEILRLLSKLRRR